MNTTDVLTTLYKLKPSFQQRYAVKNIGLFGSYADGSHTPESDIDILVEFNKPIGWKFFSLEKELENIFNKKIDLVTEQAIKERIRPFIINQIKYV